MPMVQMAQMVQKVLLYRKDQMARMDPLYQKDQKVLLIQKAQMARMDLCHHPTLRSTTLYVHH
jgi:hypothetical protein